MPRGNVHTLTNMGKGRPKGCLNKTSRRAVEMFLNALERGRDVLERA